MSTFRSRIWPSAVKAAEGSKRALWGFWVSGLRVMTLAIAILPILGRSQTSSAQESPAPTPIPAALQPLQLSVETNIERLLRIRLAFQKDPVLGPLNLGIQYRDGVVTLWGPVANPKHIQNAKTLAAKQRGVIEVRSELYVGTTGERPTGPEALAGFSEPPVRVQAASPDLQRGVIPATPFRAGERWTGSREPAFDAANAGQGNGTASSPSYGAVMPAGQVLRFPGNETGQAATTGLGPFPGPDSTFRGSSQDRTAVPQALNRTEATNTQGNAAPARFSLESPSEKLVQMRSSNDRFRGITWSLRGGDLEIQYSGGDTASAMDFARSAQILPGIRTVAVRQRTALHP